MKKTILFLLFTVASLSLSLATNEYKLSKENDTFVAHSAGKKLVKGSWLLGGTFSAKSNSLSDIDLLVVDVEKFDQRAFNFRLEGSYFFKENISVGLGLQFGEEKADLVANLLNNSYKRDIRNFSRSYGALGFIKNHIPVSSNDVFYVNTLILV